MNREDRINKFKNSLAYEALPAEFSTWLLGSDFFTAPASTKYHGAYEGGLFDHSFLVMENLVQLTLDNDLVWDRKESPYIVGLLHDLCKIDQYKLVATDKYEYDTETLFKGHGDKSIMLISAYMRLTLEEVTCIRYHMGAFTEKEEWGFYTRAVHAFPNVLWTHHADMIASHIQGV